MVFVHAVMQAMAWMPIMQVTILVATAGYVLL